jgi:hypothetical protein
LERIEEAIGRVFAFEVAGHLAAEKASSYRVVGVSAELRRPAVFDGHEQRAGVRTVKGTD